MKKVIKLDEAKDVYQDLVIGDQISAYTYGKQVIMWCWFSYPTNVYFLFTIVGKTPLKKKSQWNYPVFKNIKGCDMWQLSRLINCLWN